MENDVQSRPRKRPQLRPYDKEEIWKLYQKFSKESSEVNFSKISRQIGQSMDIHPSTALRVLSEFRAKGYPMPAKRSRFNPRLVFNIPQKRRTPQEVSSLSRTDKNDTATDVSNTDKDLQYTENGPNDKVSSNPAAANQDISSDPVESSQSESVELEALRLRPDPVTPSTMTELDKFKRRLIRTVSRLLLQEKKPEGEMWSQLQKETGCNCQLLWKRMRALTMKKMSRLLAADDRVDNLAAVARPSFTDWLLYDLVLVHEKADVIGKDKLLVSKVEHKPLIDLFSLVQRYQLEELSGDELTSAWAAATAAYNNRGRQCSPMLLQRRWFQLKELTRTSFYNLWKNYRGNNRLWTSVWDMVPTQLQMAIARRYPHVVTQSFLEWEEMIEKRLVVMPTDFEKKRKNKGSPKPGNENEPDLIVVEPVIETIDLGVDSDSEEGAKSHDDPTDPDTKDTNTQSNQPTENSASTTAQHIVDLTTVKKEPDDVDGLSNVMIVAATHIPEGTSEADETLDEIDAKLKQQSSVFQAKRDLALDVSRLIEHTERDLETVLKDDAPIEVLNVSQVIKDTKKDLENELHLNTLEVVPDVPIIDLIKEKADKFIRKTEKNAMAPTPESTQDEIDLIDDIIKQKADSFIQKTDAKLEVEDSSEAQKVDVNITVNDSSEAQEIDMKLKVKDSSEALTDLHITDGIEFVDDGIEYIEEDDDDVMAMEDEPESNETISRHSIEDDNVKFDLKLLMDPVIYTTKLDHMATFKDTPFDSVDVKNNIDSIIKESKPISKRAINVPEVKQNVKKEQTNDFNDDLYQNDDISEESDSEPEVDETSKVSVSSYMFQKARNRTYNPIILCKNPDFNTRLKRLSVGFFSSARNCTLLKACKPMTIDLYKVFEQKLVDGTVYLKSKPGNVQPVVEDENEQPVSVLPTALPMQSLIDNVAKMHEFIDPVDIKNQDIKKFDDDRGERSKVINLRDITEIRRINQQLLTAEVTPMRIQNNETCSPSVSAPNHAENRVKNEPSSVPEVVNLDNDADNSSLDIIKTSCDASKEVPKATIPETPQLVDNTKEDATVPISLNRPTIDRPEKSKTQAPSRCRPQNFKRTVAPWHIPKRNVKEGDDFLITIDTLNKMINKINGTNEYINPHRKNKSPNWVIDTPAIITGSNHVGKNKQRAGKAVNIRKGKALLKKHVCCWARAKMDTLFTNTTPVVEHRCPKPVCLCCCRDRLKDVIIEKSLGDDEMEQACKSIESEVKPPDAPPTPVVRVVSRDKCFHNTSSTQQIQKRVDTNSLIEAVAQTLPNIPNTVITPQITRTSDITAPVTVQINQDITSASPIQPKVYVPKAPAIQRTSIGTQADSISSDITKTCHTIANFSPKSNNNAEIGPDMTPDSAISSKVHFTMPAPSAMSVCLVASVETQTPQTIPCFNPPPLSPVTIKDPTLPVSAEQSPSKSIYTARKRIVIDGSKLTNIAPCTSKIGENVMLLNTKTIAKKSSDNPIFLGKNKILLTTAKLPKNTGGRPVHINQNAKVIPELPMPNGVHLILLPNGELTYTIEPGIELDDSQLALLPSILQVVQRQINTTRPQSVIPSEDDVIKLSDDESSPAEVKSKNVKAQDKENTILEVAASTAVTTKETPIAPVATNDTLTETSSNIDTSLAMAETNTDANNLVTTQITPELPNSTVSSNENKEQNDDTMTLDKAETTAAPLSTDTIDDEAQSDKNTTSLDSSKESENIEITEANNSKEATDKEVGESSEETASSSRKSLLSDLMEMSGISAEDTTPLASQEDKAPSLCTDIVNPIDSNVTELPELTAITSLDELRFACASNALFYKLDLDSGLLAPINVCVKRNVKQKKVVHVSMRSLQPKSVIDLTDDLDIPVPTSDIKNASQTTDQSVHAIITLKHNTDTATTSIQINKGEPSTGVKPIKLFKSIHSSILKPSVSSRKMTIVSSLNKSLDRQRQKQTVEAKIDLVDSDAPMEEEYLVDSSDSDSNTEIKPVKCGRKRNAHSSNSDDSSDDEPLATKFKRLRDNDDDRIKKVNEAAKGDQKAEGQIECTAISAIPTESLEPGREADADITMETDQINESEDVESGPAVSFIDQDVDESQEDCILGF